MNEYDDIFATVENDVLNLYGKDKFTFSTRVMEEVEMRSILYYILHKKYGISYSNISRKYGFDRITVTYHIKKIESYLKYDKGIQEKIKNLISK